MITLLLTRTDEQDGVYLKLPATPAEIQEAFAELDSINSNASPIRITETISNVYNLGNYLKNVAVEKPDDLSKLMTLSQKMQTMDRDSCFKFEGVLDANSVNGMDDILRLSEMLGEYALLPDAANSRTLGKYLVENDIVPFPKSVRPYLDYQIIGSDFCAEHGGAFCRAGYVVRNEELPEQYQQSEQAQEQNGIITLRLQSPSAQVKQQQSIFLSLPAMDAALENAKQKLGVDDFAEANILSVDYSLPYFATMLPQDCITVEDANKLALCIEQMNQTDGEILKYLSAVEVEKPETFHAALRIALNVEDYECVSESYEEYGRKVLERIGADEEVLDEIDGYMDYATFGKAWMQEDGAVQTEFGMLRRISTPFDTQSTGEMRME